MITARAARIARVRVAIFELVLVSVDCEIMPAFGVGYYDQVLILYIHAPRARRKRMMMTLGRMKAWATDPIREPVTA